MHAYLIYLAVITDTRILDHLDEHVPMIALIALWGGLAHETSRRYLHQRKLQQKDVGLSPTVPPLRRSSPDWALNERKGVRD